MLGALVPPAGEVAADALVVGVEVRSVGGAGAGLVDGDESGRATNALRRGRIPPRVLRAALAGLGSRVPEVGLSAGDTPVVSCDIGAFWRADATELLRLEHIGVRATGLISSIKMRERLGR